MAPLGITSITKFRLFCWSKDKVILILLRAPNMRLRYNIKNSPIPTFNPPANRTLIMVSLQMILQLKKKNPMMPKGEIHIKKMTIFFGILIRKLTTEYKHGHLA